MPKSASGPLDDEMIRGSSAGTFTGLLKSICCFIRRCARRPRGEKSEALSPQLRPVESRKRSIERSGILIEDQFSEPRVAKNGAVPVKTFPITGFRAGIIGFM